MYQGLWYLEPSQCSCIYAKSCKLKYMMDGADSREKLIPYEKMKLGTQETSFRIQGTKETMAKTKTRGGREQDCCYYCCIIIYIIIYHCWQLRIYYHYLLLSLYIYHILSLSLYFSLTLTQQVCVPFYSLFLQFLLYIYDPDHQNTSFF